MLNWRKDTGKYAKMFSEFGQALKDEMKQLEKKPPSVAITRIAPVRASGGEYYYEADMAGAEAIISGTPCALTPDNAIESYDVTVVDADGSSVILSSAEEIAGCEGQMTLHIGEKIMVQELARCLVNRKQDDCAAGERMFGKEFGRIRDVAPEHIYSEGLSESAEHAVLMATQNNASFINTAGATHKARIDLTAALLYNLYKQGSSVLYLADKNSTVDAVMLRLCEMYDKGREGSAAEGNLMPFMRPGFAVSADLPDELSPEAHGRHRSPEVFARRDELEEELLPEDVEEISRLIARQDKAEAEIAKQRKIIAEMEDVLRKTREQVEEYNQENVIKKKVLISGDYEFDKDMRMQKVQIKIDYAREVIANNEKIIESIRESKPYFDKEQRLIKLRESALDQQRKAIRTVRVLGTAMSMSYLDEDVLDRQFDVVVIDEASEIWIPALWHAGYLAKDNIILTGDIGAVPAVARGKGASINRWLRESIFGLTGMTKNAQKGKAPANMYSI